ncbi:unnamed protein product [Paramecium pentaurelia]|uniref:Pex19 protein n=1 Tax=Paramecium pentaurelia TaxID=43138 RepID=A0A8S1TIJ5_9CILI|nr:unnamed protein product [Paramecium pentaurelia]
MDQKGDDIMDDIADALDGEHKLNLTADQNDDDDEAINKECENFLNSLKGGEGQNVETDQLLKQFQGMMGNILEGINPNNQEQQKAFQDTFEKLEQAPQFDELADKMLLQFMDKDVLEQPMKETYDAYNKFIQENKNKLNEEELLKYKKQKDCVEKIIDQLNTNPNDKEKLIQLFENMQAEGDPPQEVFGGNENPLNFLNAPTEGAQGEPCNIF